MRIHVPAFPTATAIVRADGSAEVTINGVSRPIPTADVVHARREVTAAIVDLARKIHRPVRLTTQEDASSYLLAVHPSGHVSALSADGYTDAPEPPPELPPQLEAAGTAAAAPGTPTNRDRYVVTFSTGERVELEQPIIVGRLPQTSPNEGAIALQLHDTTMTVSKRHARLEPTDHGILVTDLGSANGTRIRPADGTMLTIPPGEHRRAAAGDVIEFGDTVTGTVVGL